MALSVPSPSSRRGREDALERDRTDVGEHHHQRDGKADIADAVDDERLLGRGGGRRLVLPEPDQQVRRQADAFPADVEAQVVVGEHQQQHRREEQVQIREKPTAVRVFGHVADRVDVDQRADAGDQQHEAHRKLVQLQAEVHVQFADRHPGEQLLVNDPFLAGPAEHVGEQHRADDEGAERGRAAEQVAPRVGPSPGQQQYRRACQGQGDQEPNRNRHRGLSFSAGWRRRPRPSGGCGRWS